MDKDKVLATIGALTFSFLAIYNLIDGTREVAIHLVQCALLWLIIFEIRLLREEVKRG